MITKIAWRNLWRSKRRTITSISSIFFAVILAILMRSLQEGSYGQMIDTAARFYMGYAQVHQEGYWNDKSINKLMEDSKDTRDKILSDKNVKGAFGRLETYGMAATDTLTKGVMIVGTEPEGEDQLSSLSQKMVKGTYLSNDSKDIIIGEGLAKYLGISVNDTLALLGQGYHGASAAELYKIQGIIKHPNPQMNNQVVYMSLPTVQYFVSAPNMLNAYILNIKDTRQIDQTVTELRDRLDKAKFEVMSWDELSPEMVNMINTDREGGKIMIYILYIVIAFGIFSTILMMTIEREREFGILTAVGMVKSKIYSMLLQESLFIGLIGIVSSIVAGFPILLYMENHPIHIDGAKGDAMAKMGMEPILRFTASLDIIWPQALLMAFIMIVCTIYPMIHVSRIKTVEAIHS
ncbi:ABC transporter permease [Flammeovirga agarivorans]|uniref:ABC transporter permease n=1 Tax=Flammeovirga agarivorans TaxID=2726742 RepID=A0A7X8XUF1_9BACT|nr:FtsX-like permease family protein [Flammeovirga agarivorans]NLR90050.1 ABC transporter permease [Flammeovirga agarivorans]